MSSGPPNKEFAYDLTSYTTAATRVAEINSLIDQFYNTYGVYPEYHLDSVVNCVYLGAYS